MPAQAEQSMAVFSGGPVEHPPVGTGTTIQFKASWEDQFWVPAKVIQHFGNGHVTVEVNDPLTGSLMERNNVLFVDDPDASSPIYKEHVIGLQDGGLWKATDDQSAILSQLKALSERVGGLEKLREQMDLVATDLQKRNRKTDKPEHTVDIK